MLRWRTILGLCGAIVVVALALAMLDWGALVRSAARLSISTLLVAAAFSIATTLILSLRWAVLAAPLGRRIGWRDFHDALFAQVFNVITPAAIGSDVYRVAIAHDRQGGRTRAAGLVMLERIVGVAVYAGVFLAAYLVASSRGPLAAVFSAAAASFAVLAAALIAALVLSRVLAPRIIAAAAPFPRFKWIAEAVEAASTLPVARLAATLGLSAAGVASWLGCVAVLAHGTGLALGVEALTMVAVVTEFARLLPISIQGIGVREATFASLASEAGGAAEPAFVACAAAYALHFALVALAGLLARTSQAFAWSRRIG